MGRLIDADDVIPHCCKYYKICGKYCDECDFLQIVNKIPTAFNVDKVVEQLEGMNVGKESCRDCKYRKECDKYQDSEKCEQSDELCGQVAQCLAIKIVKGGN